MAGAAGLEPVTSAVTGQRSNQLSYAPAWGRRTYERKEEASSGTTGKSGQRTPRRWGWGTPLKKRTATRTRSVYGTRTDFVNPLSVRIGAEAARQNSSDSAEGWPRLAVL